MRDWRNLYVFVKKGVCAAAAVAFLVLAGGCARQSTPSANGAGSAPTTAPTVSPVADAADEMRAVWVTYTDLQSLTSGTATQTAAAIDRLMDRLQDLRMTAVFFHVRANSDAYYPSAAFAVSAWVQPLLDAGFDPLAYAVDAAHSRGLELHAWVNPFRIGRSVKYAVCDDRFVHEGVYYYDPSSDTVQTRLLDGVRELLDGYAVDGIHFDDYFYPAGAVPADAPAEFEQAAYAAYTADGGTADIARWRRLQVDRLVAATCRLAHSRGRVFGISPAARLSHCTEALYADVGKWMREPGYVDYICPQLYFGFENGSLPFSSVVSAWAGYPRHAAVRLYVGLPLYKAGMTEDTWAGTGNAEWANGGDILARQVSALRAHEAISGFSLYASSYLFEDTHPGVSGSPLYHPDVVKKELTALHALLRGENSP